MQTTLFVIRYAYCYPKESNLISNIYLRAKGSWDSSFSLRARFGDKNYLAELFESVSFAVHGANFFSSVDKSYFIRLTEQWKTRIFHI